MTSQQDMFENPLHRARKLKTQRRYDEAQKILEQELIRQPTNLRAKASLADLFYRTDRHKDALTLAGEILRDDPDDPRALLVMGNVLLARKKPTEALDYFKLALENAGSESLREKILAAVKKIEEK